MVKTAVRTAALVVGVALIGALCLTVVAQEPQAAIPADAEYAGSKLCGMCHKDQTAAFSETPHAKHEAPAETTEPWKHGTGWDKAAGKAAEVGIRCEACHGRGSAHVKASQDERTLRIINPLSLDEPDKITSICAQCHSYYTPKEGDAPVAFTPGENLFEKIDLLPVEAGKSMQQVNEFVTGKHYTVKHMTCIQCHTSHTEGITDTNLRMTAPDLCVQCHHEQADLTHTKGTAKEGDTCLTCHMPDGVHTFAKVATTE